MQLVVLFVLSVCSGSFHDDTQHTGFTLGNRSTTSEFNHFWETGINSPHSAVTLRSDFRDQLRELKEHVGYTYTRIHAPFSRDFSISQGPNATSYFNAFSTYDYLLSIGMKPWIELGYS